MAIKTGYIFVGWLIEKYPTKYYNKFKKRYFIVKRNIRKNNMWFVTYAKFMLTKENTEDLDLIEEGREVLVKFDISGNLWLKEDKIQRNDDGSLVIFQELHAWSVMTFNERRAKQKDLDIYNFEKINPKNKDTEENSDDLMSQYKKEQNPQDRTYSVINNNRSQEVKEETGETDIPEEVDNDLPF